MRYRKLDADGDYTFGLNKTSFFINEPETVGQAVLTKLRLFWPEWQLDLDDGTKWKSEVVGALKTNEMTEIEIGRRIRQVPHVKEIEDLTVERDDASRRLTISASIVTDFGKAVLTEEEVSLNPFVTEH